MLSTKWRALTLFLSQIIFLLHKQSPKFQFLQVYKTKNERAEKCSVDPLHLPTRSYFPLSQILNFFGFF